MEFFQLLGGIASVNPSFCFYSPFPKVAARATDLGLWDWTHSGTPQKIPNLLIWS